MDHRIPSVARGEQDFQAWPSTANLLGELGAVDVGHDHIGEQQDDFGMGFQRPQSSYGAIRFKRLIAKLGQGIDTEATHRRLVLDNQNDFTAIAKQHRAPRILRSGIGRHALQPRQIDFDRRAMAKLGVDLHVTAGSA